MQKRTNPRRRLRTGWFALAIPLVMMGVSAGAHGDSAPTRPVAASSGTTQEASVRVVFHDADKGIVTPCEGLPGCTARVDRGDPQREASESTFKFTAGTEFAPHFHTSPEHVTGIAGIMRWTVGGKTYYVGPGDYLYYPSKAVHHGQCLPGADCVFHVYDDKPYDIHPAG